MRSFHNRRAIIVIGLLAIAAGITAAFIADRRATEERRLDPTTSDISPIMFDGPVMQLALGDMNGDSKADLVTLTLGSGMPHAPAIYSLPAASPPSIPYSVTVRAGTGDGGFAAEVGRHELNIQGSERDQRSTHPTLVPSIRLADLDGDSDLDVVVESTQTKQIQALQNDAQGKLSEAPPPAPVDAPQTPTPPTELDSFRKEMPMRLFHRGDFDGDKKEDFVWASNVGGGRQLFVQRATASGYTAPQAISVRSWQERGSSSQFTRPSSSPIDLSGDGTNELLTETTMHAEVLKWNFHNGKSELESVAHLLMPKMSIAKSTVETGYTFVTLGRYATGDIDGDGDTDVIAAGKLPGSAAFAYSNNGGELVPVKLAGRPASYLDKRNSPPGP